MAGKTKITGDAAKTKTAGAGATPESVTLKALDNLAPEAFGGTPGGLRVERGDTFEVADTDTAAALVAGGLAERTA